MQPVVSSPPVHPATPSGLRHRRFAAFAWVVLAYNIAVILWGAYVRAAGAGNGCGDNWPLCDGQFLPAHPQIKMLIEFLHRASSGVDAVLVFGLFVGALWLYPKRHAVRRGAAAAVFFLVTEALLGAALVLFQWVGQNTSPARIAADATHLANTLCLLAALALTAIWASGVAAPRRASGWKLNFALLAVFVTGICGAVAALADTLFPAQSLSLALRQDFSGSTALLERLRVIHPAVAIAAGLYLLWLVFDGLPRPRLRLTRGLGYALAAAVLLQWAGGALDVMLLAPIPMQMLHLATADLLWILLLLFTAATLAET
ncbi:MAG TPA: COX15/CtaA family protein [Terriglobales bacterium]|nr:COX15/CtaA family protein [Terriglobales bacterium]